MEKLTIQATTETPQIEFDGAKGIFSISGKSYPENVNDFYKPVLEYIENYIKEPCDKTTIEYSWLYYNTATTKIMMKMIMLLKNASTKLEINWYYKKDFELIKEKGQEINDVLDISLSIIQKD